MTESGGPALGTAAPDPQPVRANVARREPPGDVEQSETVILPRPLAEALQASDGDTLVLESERGRVAVGRARTGRTTDAAAVGLDRLLRAALKAKVGEQVVLRRETLAVTRKIVLRAPVDLARAHGLQGHFQGSIRRRALPCAEGGLVYCRLPGSVNGMVLDILDVEGGRGVCGEDTSVEVEPYEQRQVEGAWDVTFEEIGGLGTQIAMLRELVELPITSPLAYHELGIAPPRGIILYGPPGVGKTLISRALANELDARFYLINGPSIVGTMYGESESNLRGIFNEAAHHAPAVLLIDELDAIAPRRGESGSQSDVRIVSTLLSLMDGLQRVDGVAIIGTSNRVEAIDPALRRPGRFDREVFIGPPDRPARRDILEIHAREMPLSQDAGRFLDHVAEITHGFTGADLMELCREAALSSMRHRTSDPAVGPDGGQGGGLVVSERDFRAALGKIRPSAMRESMVIIPQTRWEDIGGHQDVKRRLRRLVERPLRATLASSGTSVRPTPGVLLYGPPGTGKSMLVEALAHATGANLVRIDGASIYSKWLGESEEAVRQAFRLARQLSPTLLYFDHLDSMAPSRDSGDGGGPVGRVLAQLLGELDSIRELATIVVVATTNRPEAIDPAVLRPGRIGTHIRVDRPQEDARRDIIARLLDPVALPAGDRARMAGSLARKTEGFSGADLVQLHETAQLVALDDDDGRPPGEDDWLEALSDMASQLGPGPARPGVADPAGRP